jgi:hypothetical protein
VLTSSEGASLEDVRSCLEDATYWLTFYHRVERMRDAQELGVGRLALQWIRQEDKRWHTGVSDRRFRDVLCFLLAAEELETFILGWIKVAIISEEDLISGVDRDRTNVLSPSTDVAQCLLGKYLWSMTYEPATPPSLQHLRACNTFERRSASFAASCEPSRR